MFFKITDKKLVEDQRSWGLHRSPSTVCSGTGRPVCQYGDLGTAPTTEHCMLEDWSTSLPVWKSGYCTNHRALHAQGLVGKSTRWQMSMRCSGTRKLEFFRPCYMAHTSPSSKLGDYICTMHLAMHLSIKISMWIFLFRPWHHVTTPPTTMLRD